MTDNGRLMTAPEPPRRHALLRWLFAFFLVVAMIQGGVLFERLEPRLLPVRAIAIDGEVHRHSLVVLQATIADRLDGSGILTADLGAIKAAVEGLPWIAEASVQRVWPERLALRVTEHRPVARWGDDGLVTAAGEVFRPARHTIPVGLARLTGAERDSRILIARYLAWRERLALLGLEIIALDQDARGAWRMQLRNELELALGSQRVDDRLTRFIHAYPTLRLAGLPLAVDLRYENGLAVRWHIDGGAMRSARRTDRGFSTERG